MPKKEVASMDQTVRMDPNDFSIHSCFNFNERTIFFLLH